MKFVNWGLPVVVFLLMVVSGCGGGGGGGGTATLTSLNIRISPNQTEVEAGGTLTFAVDAVFSDGSVQSNVAAVLAADPAVGTFVGNVFSAISNLGGKTSITGNVTASYQGINKIVSITVTKPVQSVSISSSPKTSPFVTGDTTTFTATVTYNDSSTAIVTPTWKLSSPALGTITLAGLFTATTLLGGSGSITGTLTATYGGKTSPDAPIVVNGVVTKVTVTPLGGIDPQKITTGQMVTFQGVGGDQYNNTFTLDQTKITWQLTGGLGTLNSGAQGTTLTTTQDGSGTLGGVYMPTGGPNVNLTALPLKVSAPMVTITGHAYTDVFSPTPQQGVVFTFYNGAGTQVGIAVTNGSGLFSISVPNTTKYLYVSDPPPPNPPYYNEYIYSARPGISFATAADCWMRIDTNLTNGADIGNFTFYSTNTLPPPPTNDCECPPGGCH